MKSVIKKLLRQFFPPIGFGGTPSFTATERAVAGKFQFAVNHKFDDLKKRYYSRFRNSLNTDSAKELCAEYSISNESRSQLSACVYAPAKSFIERLYVKLLEEKAVREVMFLGGGAASGKTSYVYYFPPEPSDLIVDGTMSAFDKIQIQIEMALKLGKRVRIVYVFCPCERATKFAIERSLKTGRTISLGVLAQTHFHSQKTVLRIAKHYSGNPRVRIHVIDNSDYQKPRITDLSFLQGKEYKLLDEVCNAVKTTFENECETREATGEWPIPDEITAAFRKVGREVA